MYYQTDVEKKERRRIIMISIAAAALILILLIAIIVVAAHKSSKNNDISKQTYSAFEKKEDTNIEKKKEEKTEVEVKTEEKTEDKPVISTETTTSTANSDMPNTGPEEVLPLALVLGLGTTYAASAVMAKRNQ